MGQLYRDCGQMWQYCTILPSLLLLTQAQDIHNKFSSAGLLDNVLAEPPAHVLNVKYDENVAVNLGNTLSVSGAGREPSVQFKEAEDDSVYTLAMVDPDAPSRKNPRAAQWNHWIVTDIKGSDLKSSGKVPGKTLMSYNGPSPPRGTGPHRYILLLYRQAGGEVGEVSDNRAKFDVTRFAGENGLEGPVAGNFYL